MVTCLLCDKKFKKIRPLHLKREHNTTVAEYLLLEGAVLVDERENARRLSYPVCAREGCDNKVKTEINKYCSPKCNGLVSSVPGAENPNWKGGNRSTGRREKARCCAKYNYTCQKCGIKGVGQEIHAHHIIPVLYFENPVDAHYQDNLIALCRKCHKIAEFWFEELCYKRALELEAVDNSIESLKNYKRKFIIKRHVGDEK